MQYWICMGEIQKMDVWYPKSSPDQQNTIIKIVRDRSRNNLIPALLRGVRRGTSIVTDEWKAYRRALTEEGYNHHTV